ARIEYGIPAQSGDAPVRLRVYDASGHLVRTLIDETQPPGYHSAVWNGRDEHGRLAPGGVYFYGLDLGGRQLSRQLVLIR
ncbi:MAG: hypothetical protein GF330_12850, partial [Candidatus Eisenbacteria bacterium]|nr:hypothetical protein [Candidatus Eisenbacteria bacterium]